jgi:hypothetical protein
MPKSYEEIGFINLLIPESKALSRKVGGFSPQTQLLFQVTNQFSLSYTDSESKHYHRIIYATELILLAIDDW